MLNETHEPGVRPSGGLGSGLGCSFIIHHSALIIPVRRGPANAHPAPAAAPGRRPLLAAWAVAVGLLGAAGVQLVRTYADDRCGKGSDQFPPYSADFIAAPALVEGVLADGHQLGHYQFSAATFAVPDTVLYVPVRLVTGRAGPALLPWHGLLFAALVLAAGYALAGVVAPAGRRWVGPAVLTVAAAFLAAQAAQFANLDSRHFLLPGCHAGVQTLAFIAAGLLARYLRAVSLWARAGYLCGLAVVSAAAAFSDRLFALYLAVPAFTAAGLLAALGLARAGVGYARAGRWAGRPWVLVRVVAAAGAVAAGCLGGLAGLKALPNPGTDGDPLKGYWDKVELDGFNRRAGALLGMAWAQARQGDALPVSGFAWLAVAPLVVAGAAARRALTGRPLDPAGFVWYQLFGLLAFATVGGVYVVSSTGAAALDRDTPDWAEFGRYFAGPQAVALFGWALIPAALLGSPGRRGRALGVLAFAVPAGLAVVLLAATLVEGRNWDRSLADPCPRYVRALDEACTRRGLSAGYCGYWEAKEVNLFSKAGVRALQVQHHRDNPDVLTPYVWLSNADDYSATNGRPDPPAPRFMVARAVTSEGSDISADTVRAFFGPPAEEVRVENIVILVYDRPGDARFWSVPARGAGANLLRYRLDPRQTLRFPGAGLPGRPDTFDPTGTKTAREVAAPKDSGGHVAWGPYLVPRLTGPHFAEFRVRSAGTGESNAEVEVLCAEDGAKDSTVLAHAAVPPNSEGTIRLEFDVTPAMTRRGRLEFRTGFSGAGRLALEHVDFGPVGR